MQGRDISQGGCPVFLCLFVNLIVQIPDSLLQVFGPVLVLVPPEVLERIADVEVHVSGHVYTLDTTAALALCRTAVVVGWVVDHVGLVTHF